MAKYKVYYEGFVYVEAPSESIAQLAYEEYDVLYGEEELVEIVEVDDFIVEELNHEGEEWKTAT